MKRIFGFLNGNVKSINVEKEWKRNEQIQIIERKKEVLFSTTLNQWY